MMSGSFVAVRRRLGVGLAGRCGATMTAPKSRLHSGDWAPPPDAGVVGFGASQATLAQASTNELCVTKLTDRPEQD